MPKVSIVICAYNAEATLLRAIESSLNQTYRSLEVIVVDDGSTDRTSDIVVDQAKQDNRLRLVKHDTNRQLFEARRTGLHAACGTSIVYLDADDTLRPDMVEICMATADAAADELLIVHTSIMPKHVKAVPESVQQEREAYFAAYNGELRGDDIVHAAFLDRAYTWNICGKLFSRRLLELAYDGFPDTRLFEMEDAVLYFAIAHWANLYIGLPDVCGMEYWIDSGGSARYDNISKAGIALSAMRDYAERIDVRLKYWDDLETLRRTQLQNMAMLLLSLDDSRERTVGYKSTIQHVPSIEFDRALDAVSGGRDWMSLVGLGSIKTSFDSNLDSARTILDEIDACTDTRRYPTLLACLANFCRTFSDQHDMLAWLKDYPARPNLKRTESVAQYYYETGDSGIGQTMLEFASLFQSMGLSSSLITANKPVSKTSPLNDSFFSESIAEFGNEFSDLFPVLDHLNKLYYLLHKGGVDTYVYHAWLSPQCLWDLLLCRLLGVKFILVIHDAFSSPLTLTTPERTCFSTLPYLATHSDAVACFAEIDYRYFSQFNSNSFVLPHLENDSARPSPEELNYGHNQEKHVPTACTSAQSDLKDAWNLIFSCERHSANALEVGNDEGAMWRMLFEHESLGDQRMQKFLARLEEEREKAAQDVRAEFESSVTWRIGRLVTALPRKVLGRS